MRAHGTARLAVIAATLLATTSACAVTGSAEAAGPAAIGRTVTRAAAPAVAPHRSAARAVALPNPVYGGGAAKNVAFYYSGPIPLVPANVAKLHKLLGHPSVIVAPRFNDSSDPASPTNVREAEAIKTIHLMGAKAYRYVNYFWAPTNQSYDGIDLSAHPDWAYCTKAGSTSLLSHTQPQIPVGRTVGPTPNEIPWEYIDANNTDVQAAMAKQFALYKSVGLYQGQSQGWDGVMFDRGQASTQSNLKVPDPTTPYWATSSKCTPSNKQWNLGRGPAGPTVPLATVSDTYVQELALAKSKGLQVMANSGDSPLDPIAPMRPDPRNAACQKSQWTKCDFLGDIWNSAGTILDEMPGRTRLTDWARDFTGNQRAERDASHGHRTVALITTSDLGGANGQNRATVYYVWSRIKLFNLAVGVNTGSGDCSTVAPGRPCNQGGSYPELVDTRFGAPLTAAPQSTSCTKGSKISCVWSRRYAQGASLLNATGSKRSVTVSTGIKKCRYVYDELTKKPLAGNKCVTKLKVTLAPWSGHPLTYSTKRHA
ncbi:MAG: hypothetical protein FWE71_09625 [Nocardioidaceae bacterium]|nr:hypothetical protein [Nocardioidaceae bacterium]MCL2612335.1 hypothetical protein [Nocardioidaceae bacterium]